MYLPLNSIKRDARGVAQGRRHCQEGGKQEGGKDRCRCRGGQSARGNFAELQSALNSIFI